MAAVFSNVNKSTNTSNDTSWKARGFLNLWAVNTLGKLSKLGKVSLRQVNKSENQLAEFIEAKTENLAKVIAKMTFEFVDPTTLAAGFAGTKVQGSKYDEIAGFINLMLPNTEGKPTRVGGITLRKDQPAELALAKRLVDPAEFAAFCAKELTIQYNLAEPKATSGFDLS